MGQFDIYKNPPQSGYFVDSNGNAFNIIDSVSGALSVSMIGSNDDAFGRQRVSEPFTLNDYKHIYGLDPNMIQYVGGIGSTITYQPNQACALISSGTGATSFAIHQSKMYHNYMPGKSQLVLSSFNMQNGVTYAVKRTGYYDDKNGAYFEIAGNTLSFNIRTYTGGSATVTSIPQSQWNIDKCDGTGNSKFNIDITKTQLLFVDFQWLGVGRARFGFVHNGIPITAHEFYHSNVLPLPYMSNPNLPIRCEVANITTTAVGTTMLQICSTVISEGGYVESGIDWSYGMSSGINLAVGAEAPVMAIRLKNAYKTYDNRGYVRYGALNIVSTGSNVMYFLFKYPGSTTGNITGTWTDVDVDSIVQYAQGPGLTTVFSTGNQVVSGYVVAGSGGSGGNAYVTPGNNTFNPASVAKKNFIAQNYLSTDSEAFLVYAKNIGTAGTSVLASLQWREVF